MRSPVGVTASAHVESTTWTPAALPNLVGWWDAADASSFSYSSGAVVSEWRDKSGNARHFAQADTSMQPARTGSRNGNSTLVFDGAGDYLDTPSFALPQPLTAIIAADFNDSALGSTALSSRGDNLQMGYGGSGRLAYYAGAAEVDSQSTGFTGGPRVFAVVMNGGASASWIDGEAKGAGNPGSAGTVTGLRIAERNLNSVAWFRYAMFEIIVCGAALSAIDRQAAEAYLKTKWSTP